MKASATFRNEEKSARLGRRPLQRQRKEKGPEPEFGAFFNFIPAATYVPTQLPVQYHRRGWLA